MIIQFERTGGIAGMRLAATIDSENLPEDEGRGLQEMVQAAAFFDLPASSTAPAGADQFHYRVTIEDQGRRHTVEVGDVSAPDALQPLLRRLTLLARSGGG